MTKGVRKLGPTGLEIAEGAVVLLREAGLTATFRIGDPALLPDQVHRVHRVSPAPGTGDSVFSSEPCTNAAGRER